MAKRKQSALNRYYENRWIRWAISLIFGLVFKFTLDVVYSLIYRNEALFQAFDEYLLTIICTFLVFEGAFWMKKRLNVRQKWETNPYKRFFVQWLLLFCLALGVAFVVRWAIILLFTEFVYVRFLDEIIILTLVFVVITVIVVSDLSVFLLEKWRFSLAELERFKKENAEFQYESLKAQVNPHFLFNNLNTLSSLLFQDQEKAGLFIRELSDVYRYILENTEQELVKLSHELKMVKSYIYLVQLRFEQNLSIEINIKDGNMKRLIAPLTIQMLIENGIKHNIISKKMPLKILIHDSDHYIVVENNMQKKELPEYTSRLGLNNIKNRYKFLSEKQIEVVEDGESFKVIVPLIN